MLKKILATPHLLTASAKEALDRLCNEANLTPVICLEDSEGRVVARVPFSGDTAEDALTLTTQKLQQIIAAIGYPGVPRLPDTTSTISPIQRVKAYFQKKEHLANQWTYQDPQTNLYYCALQINSFYGIPLWVRFSNARTAQEAEDDIANQTIGIRLDMPDTCDPDATNKFQRLLATNPAIKSSYNYHTEGPPHAPDFICTYKLEYLKLTVVEVGKGSGKKTLDAAYGSVSCEEV